MVKEVTELDANSKFPSDDIMTFAEYYHRKYNINILNSNNSLLLVKALSNRLNCIKPRGVGKTKRKAFYNLENEDIHLIPELCVKQEFPACLWIQASILPTILDRIYQLLLCTDLRQQISTEAGIGTTSVNNWKPLVLHYCAHYIEKISETGSVIMNIAPTAEVEVIEFNTSKYNKDLQSTMLQKLYPWSNEEEPVDIERNLKVTLLDVQQYVNFTTTNLTALQREYTNNIQHNTLSIEYNKDFVPMKISNLLRNDVNMGPELRDICEALCTAKANDIVNLERYETLGDSFLKLIVSIYIVLKFPKYDEGQATVLKSKLISNKNLYYVGVKKNIGGILKSADFEPRGQWIPPGFTIPSFIENGYKQNEFVAKNIHKINLHPDEQIAGVLTDDTISCIQSDEFKDEDADYTDEDQSAMYFFGYQEVADKTVADVVEALLGVYFKTCGLLGDCVQNNCN